MKMMKKKVAVGLLTAVLAAPLLAVPALALEAKLSGQVNQMVMWADDGNESNVFVTDNDASSTRFRFTGEEALNDSIKAGFQIELEAQRNPSNSLTIDLQDDDDASFSVNDRWLNAYFDTKYGKIEIGKGDAAANGTAEVDLSKTNLVTYSDVRTSAGGFLWRNSDGSYFDPAGTATTLSVGGTRSNFDGYLSRSERLRYNSPNFAGVTAATSAGNGGAWDASVFYAAEIFGKLAAAAGYTNPQRQIGQANYVEWAASASWLAPFGLNLTGSYGMRDVKDGDDASNYYLKAGYIMDIHAFSIEYSVTSDLPAKGYTSSNYGATYVIKPWAPTELYAAYRMYKLDAPGDDPKDINQCMVGTRIKF